MKPFLLDVNVPIALAWNAHIPHEEAQRWFAQTGSGGFRFCRITQTALVRTSSNPAFTSAAVT